MPMRLTGNALLSDDEVGLDGQNGIAQGLDLLLLDLQDSVPVILLLDLNVGLGLALLVLERAVEENDAGVLYASAHLGVCDILVEHHTVEDGAVLDLATGDLFDTGVALDINFGLAVSSLPSDCANGLEGKVAHEIHPAGHKLGTNRRGDKLVHGLVVADVDRCRNFLDDIDGVLESTLEGRDDDDGVDVAFELGEGLGQNFASCKTS